MCTCTPLYAHKYCDACVTPWSLFRKGIQGINTSITLIFTIFTKERNLNKARQSRRKLSSSSSNKHSHVLCQDPCLEYHFGLLTCLGILICMIYVMPLVDLTSTEKASDSVDSDATARRLAAPASRYSVNKARGRSRRKQISCKEIMLQVSEGCAG